VKLGGSVLTRKRHDSALRPKVLARLALELAQVPEARIVLLHGAGSFGHPGAVRWRLAQPPDREVESPSHRARGASIVQSEVRRLHGAVLRAIIDAGGNPWSAPAASLARNRAGRLIELNTRPITDARAAGLLPVSFGDVVVDEEWGFSILSADTIAVDLVRRGIANRVLFVSDVPGVLAPSQGGRPRIIPQASADLLDGLRPRSGVPDVTGGIRGKVSAMLEIARAGADAGLISGLTDGALSRALRGEKVYGTWADAVPR
jgi:isopentenyl phosphate kinase